MGKVTVERGRAAGRERIFLTFEWDQILVDKAKAVGGGRWAPSLKAWTYPLSLDVCRSLREQYGAHLLIGPELWSWARHEGEREAELKKIGGHSSAEPLPLLLTPGAAPAIDAAMRERGYQTVVPAFARGARNFFIADQPGLGKTVETLASLIECEVRGDVLVLAPRKALRATWLHEIEKWLGTATTRVTFSATVVDDQEGTGPKREQLLMEARDRDVDLNFILINPEAARVKPVCPTGACRGNAVDCEYKSEHTREVLHPALFAAPWSAIVLDETHRFMMNGNERSTAVSQTAFGIQHLPQAEGCVKIGMSGTPFKGKPRRFWPVLHWLDPVTYSSQWRWAGQLFKIVPDGFSVVGKQTDEYLEGGEEKLAHQLDRIMVRRTKRELHAMNPAWAPPVPNHIDILLPMEPRQRKAYREMAAEAEAQLEDGTLYATGLLAEFTRLKQLASAYGTMGDGFTPILPSNKWSWLREEFLEPRGILDNDGDSKVIISSQFVMLLHLFANELEKLGVRFSTITGKTRRVEAIQDRWQAPYEQGDPRIILLSTTAGGVSLNLDAADDVVICDETWVADDQEQAWGRAHRTSHTDHQVNVYWLHSEQTIEETLFNGNLSADDTQKRLLDGRRGVEFARQVLGGVG
jgi:SNF2 family DNA or RNA helicase